LEDRAKDYPFFSGIMNTTCLESLQCKELRETKETALKMFIN